MSLSNDLNLLAANNIIGYDTCAQTLNGVGIKRSGYNPYGVGKLNTGLTQDIFNSSKAKNTVKTGILGGLAFALTSKLVGAIGKEMPKNAKVTHKKVKKFFNLKMTKTKKASVSKVAKKGTKGAKGVLSKIGKFGKGALIATGVATIASGVLKLCNSTQNTTPVNVQDK